MRTPARTTAVAIVAAMAFTAASARADDDAPALRYRFDPGREEVYETEITLESDTVWPGRKKTAGQVFDLHWRSDLALELVVAAGDPIEGASPITVAIAGARSSLTASGAVLGGATPEASWEIPTDRIGLAENGVVGPTGALAWDGPGGWGGLPEAPAAIRKRALIDLDYGSFLNAGILSDRPAHEWIATTRVMVPGEGWEGDYVRLDLRERYRIVEQTDDGLVTIEARLVDVKLASGFEFKPDKHLHDGLPQGGRWIQASFAIEGAAHESERRIVFDRKAARIVEARSELRLVLRRGEHENRLVRTDVIRRVAGGPAIARLRAARAPIVKRFRVAVEVEARRPAEGDGDEDLVAGRVALEGIVRAERDAANDGWDARFTELSARVGRVASDGQPALEESVTLADVPVRRRGFISLDLDALVRASLGEKVEAAENEAALAALSTAIRAGLGEEFPWELIRRRGEAHPADAGRLELTIPAIEAYVHEGTLRAFPLEVRDDHARALLRADGADRWRIERSEREDGSEVEGVIETVPGTRELDRLELRVVRAPSSGVAHHCRITWRRIDDADAGSDDEDED